MNAYEKMHQALLALDAWAKVVKNNPKDKTAIECAEFVEETIKAALAEPPRNCDRPECATLEMATRTWILEVFGPLCNGKATTDDIRTFDVWIYDPATEQEGGEG